MTALQDLRRHRRIVPPRPLHARFELKGVLVSAVEIVSVGAGGFGAWVEDRYAALFEPGGRLKALIFEDAHFPEPPDAGRVVFSTLKGQSARAGYIMVGVEFLEVPEAFGRHMEALIQGDPEA
ncbi:MAG TPA: hypothetical protein VJ600_09680 [Holophagaceae bacterium]|nr:hypothetical protein [Holophagaceae bacterium]